MVELWNEALGQWALPVWMAIAVLALVWLVVPPVVLRVGRRAASPGSGWAASAALLPLAALPALLLVPFERAPYAMLGGLTLPLLVLVAFLVARTTAPVCDDCGHELRRRWRFCPYHEHAAMGAAFGAVGAAAVGMPPPSPIPVGMPTPGFSVPGAVPPAPFVPGFGPGFGHLGPLTSAPVPTGPSVGSVSVASGADQGRTFPVMEGGVTIGRDVDSEVCLGDPAVSGRHARIVVSDGRAQLIDLGSANGTTIGGRAVDRAFLYDGDRIEVGDTVLVYQELRR